MAANEERTENATEAVEQAGDGSQGAVGGAADRVKALTGGDGVPKKVWVPAAIAAATAAAGYAASKGAPKARDAAVSKARDAAASKAEEAAEGVASEAERRGGVTGVAARLMRKGGEGGGVLSGITETIGSKLPGRDQEPTRGWGKGRRNPIQRYVDVGVPLQTAYNQWTQFEEFPKFMHRVTSVKQDEEERQKVHWEEKIWFSRRQWDAEITEQIPDERIKWRTVSGTSHVGHVSFHRLDDELTRVIVNIDFQPTGLFEKMGSGLRFVKRAAQSDLARFKAFIETHGQETGAWRGRIENAEVVRDAGVKEGKPFEEGKELHTPEGIGEEKKPKRRDEDESKREAPERGGDREPARGTRREGGAGAEARRRPQRERGGQERESDRRQREQRREQRRRQVAT
jgi:uncharacterized membrane protein